MRIRRTQWILSPKKIFLVILLVSMTLVSSCHLDKLSPPGWLPDFMMPDPDKSDIPDDPGEPGDPGSSGVHAYQEDEQGVVIVSGQDLSSDSGNGELKPVGFVNYGEFNATVRAYTYMPLGSTEPGTPSAASTTSSANTGSGTWPNTSRFISVPMGAYSWCIDWEEGDLDEDGKFDYFHYIEEGPTVLDENDSDELDFAEEVAISAPPSIATVYKGKCKEITVESACTEFNSELNVYTYLAYESDNPPDIRVLTNLAENQPPDGIQVSVGGISTPWGGGMILWQAGDYVEATTSNPYTAFGGQIFGDHTIGWGRVIFDGNEIWRGDASTFTIVEGQQYGVYVEVRCFPPGTHTMRIECLGINGSGGGMSVPSGFFGFRH